MRTNDFAVTVSPRSELPARLRRLAGEVASGPLRRWPSIDALAAFGDERLPGLVADALSSGDWDDCVARFGAAAGEPVAVFAGPMRANEGGPAEPGMFVARREEHGSQVFTGIAERLADLGERLFGFACDLHGRFVEFRDLVLAAGPLVGAPDAPIALFTPFYLGGWQDRHRQFDLRRTIMFSNVVVERFRAIAASTADRGVTVGGAPSRLVSASETELRHAVAAWLTLHETMHGSGPAPFFAGWTGKESSASYGVVEEVRVDMTAFLAAGELDEVCDGGLVRELIALERVLRSGRRGLVRARPEFDDEHGLVWLNVLTAGGALSTSDGGIDIDLDAAVGCVTTALADIYQQEQRAAEAEDAPAVLEEAGRRFRARYLDRSLTDRAAVGRLLSLGAGLPTTVRIGWDHADAA